MASITSESIQSTLEKIKARRQQKAIEGISPKALQAIRNLDRLKSTSDNKDKGVALFGPDKDFNTMMENYRDIHKCTGPEAHRAISKMYPQALERCIREANS